MKLGSRDVLHYLEFGKGTPVVLVPSLWVTSKSYRVLIPDIFRGKSEFPRLATSIDAYTAKPGFADLNFFRD